MENRINKTYILAEMASSHEGKLEIAESIIESAAKAKADGILLQIIHLDSYIIPSDEDYKMVKRIYLSQGVWLKLIKKANSLGLDVWANVYDVESVRFCGGEKIKGFKLHSSNLENEDLVREVSRLKKRILLSVGGMEEKEIKRILKFFKKSKICLMYGLQNFPTDPKGINLNFIAALSKKLKIPFGYQDHSEPTSLASAYLPILFIARRASIIEKHITHNRALKGLDYQAALNPDEFAKFVREIRIIDEVLSREPDFISQEELKYRKYKSLMKVVAKRDIKKGERFSKDNLAVMRAKKGEIEGKKLKLLLNKKARSSYKKFEPIKNKF